MNTIMVPIWAVAVVWQVHRHDLGVDRSQLANALALSVLSDRDAVDVSMSTLSTLLRLVSGNRPEGMPPAYLTSYDAAATVLRKRLETEVKATQRIFPVEEVKPCRCGQLPVVWADENAGVYVSHNCSFNNILVCRPALQDAIVAWNIGQP